MTPREQQNPARTIRKALYAVVYYFWVCLPGGMGGAPWHRFHPIFKLEKEDRK